MHKLWFYIFLYVGAVTAANLLVNHFGPSSSIYIAFFFIGFDLTSRDNIHELFGTNNLKLKFFFLILAGSLVSYLLNEDVRNIAIASGTAFGVSASIDTVIYQLLHKQNKQVKILTSNLFSGFADSFIFLTLAFGFLPETILLQSLAKIFGGAIWMGLFYYAHSFILRHRGKEVELSSSKSW